MKVAIVKETAPNERRVALVPEAIGKLTAAGHEVLVQAGAGDGASIPDADFTAAGAKVVAEDALYAEADVVLRVQKPTPEEVGKLRKGQVVMGLLQPLIDPQNAQSLAAPGSPRSASTRCRGHCRARRPWTRCPARPTSAATRRWSWPPTPTAATSRC